VAAVQPGYGNAAPMQVEIDPTIFKGGDGLSNLMSLIMGHFRLGGTQVSINVIDANQVLEAHKDPDRYPDLIVRATGFSVYFYTLSPEFRQMVVDRILLG
jgi:pyruvate-formate lyase